MKSLLFQGNTPFIEPALCTPCRKEVSTTIKHNGRLYTVVLRDKISVEDPYVLLIKAAAFAIRAGEPYMGTPPARAVRNFLIYSSVTI